MRVFPTTLLILSLSLTSAIQANPADELPEPTDIFLTLTSEDPEIQFMALVISMEAAKEGAQVRILLCGEAGDLALSDVESPAILPPEISPAQLLERLLEHGALVQVCAIYLPQRELDPSELREGITTATPPEIAAIWQDSSQRLLSF
ncbi:MAG: DsrE family protein [Opitutales bacterium]|nr:DsrE family protein [Opitutales bacterium]